MTKVYITAGIPASGKSHYTKELNSNKELKTIRFSSDEIREKIPGLTNAEVFGMMSKGVESCVKSGIFDEIYYDATNTSRKRRRSLYRNIKSWDKDAEVIVLFFSVSYEYAKHMNKKRIGNARVPNDVILRMHRSLQVPRLDVDCDRFEVVGIPIFQRTELIEEAGDVDDLLISVFLNFDDHDWNLELSEIMDMKHLCFPHHEENVDTHINMCIKNSKTKTLKQISLFHDLGKGITQVVGDNGRASYRGHSDVSAHYFLNYLALTKYKDKEIPDFELDILEVIHSHMNMYGSGLGTKNIRNNLLNDKIIYMMNEFNVIDKKSRITTDV